MNIKKYIDIILLQLSNKYQINLTEIITYKDYKKYKLIKVIIYKVIGKNKKQYKTIEAKSERELLLKLKEMM